MSEQLYTASREWATRPDDQRFLSLDDLRASVAARRRESWTATPRLSTLRVLPQASGDIRVGVFDPTSGERRELDLTHWSFSQLSQSAGAPAGYLRKLPAELAAINLQYGLEKLAAREDGLILGQSNGHHSLRAITSTSYGRIWDQQVVEAVQRVNQDGQWQVPAASYSLTNPKRATTLYASDHDVFIFLVDPTRPIKVAGNGEDGGQDLYRGFFAWNSETGASTFGLTTFLYSRVCDNRIIWGATEVRELRIRHTGGAPERFAYEGARYLRRYAEETAAPLEAQIQRAQQAEPLKNETMSEWLRERGFSKAESTGAEAAAEQEQSGRSLWDIVQGVTAYARSIPHADERVALETKAGKLMAQVAT